MPDWNRGELVDRLRGYGHHYKDVGTLRDWINLAVEEYLEEHTWAWARRTTNVVSGDRIDDLGTVEHVVDVPTKLPLEPIEYDDLLDLDPLLSMGGPPSRYYLQDETLIGQHPSSGSTMQVVYFTGWGWVAADGVTFKQAATEDDDVPIVPARQRGNLVLLARTHAKSESQDHDEVAAIRAQYEAKLEEARSGNRKQVDELRRVRITSTDDWA